MVLFFIRRLPPISSREQRLMAFVVAPDIKRSELLAALRVQIDAAFLPRPLLLRRCLATQCAGQAAKSRTAGFRREKALHANSGASTEEGRRRCTERQGSH